MMFPLKKKGYTIDYSNPFHEPYPTHECKTYRVKETSYLVWCPLCIDYLKVYGEVVLLVNVETVNKCSKEKYYEMSILR